MSFSIKIWLLNQTVLDIFLLCRGAGGQRPTFIIDREPEWATRAQFPGSRGPLCFSRFHRHFVWFRHPASWNISPAPGVLWPPELAQRVQPESSHRRAVPSGGAFGPRRRLSLPVSRRPRLDLRWQWVNWSRFSCSGHRRYTRADVWVCRACECDSCCSVQPWARWGGTRGVTLRVSCHQAVQREHIFNTELTILFFFFF